MLLIGVCIIGLQGTLVPAVGDTMTVTTKVPIDTLIANSPKPDYDRDVLVPLRAAQAKAEADRVAATLAREKLEQQREVQVAQVPMVAIVPTGSHQDWLTAAGIDPSNWGYVEYIVSHESGWNPCSYYPGQSNCSLTASEINGTSGVRGINVACGLGMQLPCGKWAGDWRDPIAALRAMDIYVGKFGGWAGAYNYWLVHHNY